MRQIGGWPYDEVTEVTLPRELELGLAIILGPSALFVIGTFFFLSGILAPRGIARYGPAGLVRQRMLRLGIPWLFFTILVWHLVMWVAYRSAGHTLSFWQVLQARQPFLDSGPLWFVQILLYVSVGHALFTWAGQRDGLRPLPATLVMTAVMIAVSSFAIRIWFPARSQQFLDLHVWQWPQCIGLYALAFWWLAKAGPLRTVRRCGMAVFLTVTAGVAVVVLLGVSDLKLDGVLFLGGWHWQALALDVVEATLVVAGSVWLLGSAQRWLTSQASVLTRAARSAYAAYLPPGTSTDRPGGRRQIALVACRCQGDRGRSSRRRRILRPRMDSDSPDTP
jgi:hypothetical protein